MDKEQLPVWLDNEEPEDEELFEPWLCLTLDEMLSISNGHFKIKTNG